MLKLKLQYFGHQMWRTDCWKRPWFWERLKAGGEGDDRGWDGWMASPTQRTWIWVNSSSWWWTGRPGGLQSMGSQRVRHDWATELNWCYTSFICTLFTHVNILGHIMSLCVSLSALSKTWVSYQSYQFCLDIGNWGFEILSNL